MRRMRLGQILVDPLDLLKRLIAEKEQKESQYSDLTIVLSQVKGQLDSLREQVLAEIERLRGVIAQLDTDIASIQTQITAIQAQIDEIKAELGL